MGDFVDQDVFATVPEARFADPWVQNLQKDPSTPTGRLLKFGGHTDLRAFLIQQC